MRDTGIPARTVREHYRMLEDTLVGFELPPFRRTLERKPVATSKFYLFDVGVANALLRRGSEPPRKAFSSCRSRPSSGTCGKTG